MCADVVKSEERSRPEQRLSGRVAVVTGAGRGLGQVAACALATAGARVALLGRGRADLEATAAQIRASGGSALVVPTDVTREEDLIAAAATVKDTWGGCQILVNNAGAAMVRPFLETDTAALRGLLEVNLIGALLTARIFGAQLTAGRWGRLINMASIAGLVGEPNLAVYSASKGALISLTKALAIEWARYGVTVNALAPGYFRTDLNAQAFDNPEVADRLLKKIPLRRAGEPAELAPLLVYLASEDSGFMTGSVLVIDGGQVAR
jgi:NAD(P)-dependent dehydrogenase (short-subunit alcohol dehydrogenase family)